MRTFLCITLFLWVISCTKQKVIDSIASPCYIDDPINELVWMPNKVQYFKTEYLTPTLVSLYIYKNQQFIAFENALVSGPAGYIFNCEGVNITQLGINYNEFQDNAKRIKTIFELNRK